MSDSVWPHKWQPTRLPHPWDSPGKNNGVGCHFLLPCMKVKSESEVAPSCPTLPDPMDCSLPGSSVHGIFQARVLEWGAIAFSDLTDGKEEQILCLQLGMSDGTKTILQSRFWLHTPYIPWILLPVLGIIGWVCITLLPLSQSHYVGRMGRKRQLTSVDQVTQVI